MVLKSGTLKSQQITISEIEIELDSQIENLKNMAWSNSLKLMNR